ncbi:MAG: NUDIX domain-containing protein [Paludibacter sp.]|nr:NUDIX domain-containing protein [Paludibacter sp.]
MIRISENQYNGIIVDHDSLPGERTALITAIERLLASKHDKNLVWIKIPIEKAALIPEFTLLGFEFHHCDERNLMLVKKINPEAFVPATKNYIVGVGAIVFHKHKLLVIKDRFSTGYKLPGGHIEKNESIKDALAREVFEETGINIRFESIVNIGHFRNGQFGESNLYLVCTAQALSYEIKIHDESEILDARWISPVTFLESEEVNAYNKSVVEAAINNKELKLTEQQVKLRATNGEIFF